MKYTVSIKNNFEFRRVYGKGKSSATSRMVVYYRPNKLEKNRLGLTVSTKIGKAVHRNKIRRRFKEIYRLNEEKLVKGYDLVIVARHKARYSEYFELERDFMYLAGKLGLLGDK